MLEVNPVADVVQRLRGLTRRSARCNFHGSFDESLVPEKWPDLIFKYDNSQSSSVKLTTDIVELQFHVEGEVILDSFVGSITDFGLKQTIEGFRIKDKEVHANLQSYEKKKAAIRTLFKQITNNG